MYVHTNMYTYICVCINKYIFMYIHVWLKSFRPCQAPSVKTPCFRRPKNTRYGGTRRRCAARRTVRCWSRCDGRSVKLCQRDGVRVSVCVCASLSISLSFCECVAVSPCASVCARTFYCGLAVSETQSPFVDRRNSPCGSAAWPPPRRVTHPEGPGGIMADTSFPKAFTQKPFRARCSMCIYKCIYYMYNTCMCMHMYLCMCFFMHICIGTCICCSILEGGPLGCGAGGLADKLCLQVARLDAPKQAGLRVTWAGPLYGYVYVYTKISMYVYIQGGAPKL